MVDANEGFIAVY